MANDQNKLNKKPANGIPDAIDESSLLTEFERIGERSRRKSIQYSTYEQRIREEGKQLNELMNIRKNMPMAAEGPFVNERIDELRGSISSTRSRLNNLDTGARTRATVEASNHANRYFGGANINSQVASATRDPNVQNRAFGMMNMSAEELSARREGVMSEIRQTEGLAQRDIRSGLFTGRGTVDPEKSAILGVREASMRSKVGELAQINAAQNLQRYNSTDPVSRLRKINEIGAEASGLLGQTALSQELNSGSIGIKDGGGTRQVANADINKELENQARILTQALKELAAGANKTDEELKNLRTTADEATDNFEKLKQVSGGGGGGIDKSQLLGALGGGFNAAAGAVQQIAVNQRLGQTANISGYAGIENQKYDTYRKAAGGDVMSQMLLGQFGDANTFGKELKTGANTALGLQVAGGVAQTAAGAAQIASTINPAENAIATSSAMSNRIQGGLNVAQGLAGTSVGTADLARGVSGSAADIQGQQASMAARRALLEVGASQLQGFRDFSVNSGSAAQMLGGSRGGDFLRRTISGANMEQMVNSRLSPDQFNQMATAGAESMGSTFNESQIFSARGLERSGFGTMSANMQRMSTLAAAGSNNPQAGLGSVLEAAFSKGLEGSKVLSMVAENTASMVAVSAGRAAGLDTTAATASIFTAGINASDPNQEFATNRAATARDIMRGIGTDTGVNFAAMAATSRISKATGASGDEAILLQKLSDEDLATLKGQEPNQIRSFMTGRGVNVKQGQEKQFVESLMDARLQTNLQAGAAGLATGMDVDAVSKLIKNGKGYNDMTEDQQRMVGKAGTFAGFANGEEFIRQAGAAYAPQPNQITKDQVSTAMSGKGGSEELRTIDDMRTQGFKQLSQAAMEATKNFKTAGDALKALGELSKQVEKIGDTGGEGKFSTAAADSAGTFGRSTIQFEKSVKVFSESIDAIISKSGLSSDSVAARRAGSNLIDADNKSRKLGN